MDDEEDDDDEEDIDDAKDDEEGIAPPSPGMICIMQWYAFWRQIADLILYSLL